MTREEARRLLERKREELFDSYAVSQRLFEECLELEELSKEPPDPQRLREQETMAACNTFAGRKA